RMVAAMPIEMNNASLSLVPKVAIAKSFSHGGVKSIMVEPSAKNGDEALLKNAEANWATANMTAAALKPATAWKIRMLLPCLLDVPTPTHRMRYEPCSPAVRRGTTTHSVFGTSSAADWIRRQGFVQV